VVPAGHSPAQQERKLVVTQPPREERPVTVMMGDIDSPLVGRVARRAKVPARC
jgi:hypothetical protein